MATPIQSMSKDELKKVPKSSFCQDNIRHIQASLTNRGNELFSNIQISFRNNLQTSKKTLNYD
jgi:hypothetical protein